jgi:hypothetical protein
MERGRNPGHRSNRWSLHRLSQALGVVSRQCSMSVAFAAERTLSGIARSQKFGRDTPHTGSSLARNRTPAPASIFYAL